MAAVDPDALPDLLHLQVEDLLVGVDRLVDAVGFDEGVQVHHRLLRSGQRHKGRIES